MQINITVHLTEVVREFAFLWNLLVCRCVLRSGYVFFLFTAFTDDLDGAKDALSKMKYFVTNCETLHPLLPDE